MSRRSAMLRYKSWILHYLGTLIFSPALLAGPMEEKQTLKVEMFSEFLEIPVSKICQRVSLLIVNTNNFFLILFCLLGQPCD